MSRGADARAAARQRQEARDADVRARAKDEAAKPIPVWKLLLRTAWSAVPDFGLAACFAITWVRPYTLGETAVHHFTFLMLLEFLVVHSTGFLAAVGTRDNGRWERALMYSVLFLFYALMAAGFSASYGSLWPLAAFSILMLSKAPNVLFRPHGDDAMFALMSNWAAMTCLYLGGIFFTLVYDIPPLGVTPEVIAAQEFSVGGEWPEQPYRVMAFGVIYFSGLGLLSILTELFAYWRAVRRARA
jgi:hypothetical protein